MVFHYEPLIVFNVQLVENKVGVSFEELILILARKLLEEPSYIVNYWLIGK